MREKQRDDVRMSISCSEMQRGRACVPDTSALDVVQPAWYPMHLQRQCCLLPLSGLNCTSAVIWSEKTQYLLADTLIAGLR